MPKKLQEAQEPLVIQVAQVAEERHVAQRVQVAREPQVAQGAQVVIYLFCHGAMIVTIGQISFFG